MNRSLHVYSVPADYLVEDYGTITTGDTDPMQSLSSTTGGLDLRSLSVAAAWRHGKGLPSPQLNFDGVFPARHGATIAKPGLSGRFKPTRHPAGSRLAVMIE